MANLEHSAHRPARRSTLVELPSAQQFATSGTQSRQSAVAQRLCLSADPGPTTTPKVAARCEHLPHTRDSGCCLLDECSCSVPTASVCLTVRAEKRRSPPIIRLPLADVVWLVLRLPNLPRFFTADAGSSLLSLLIGRCPLRAAHAEMCSDAMATNHLADCTAVRRAHLRLCIRIVLNALPLANALPSAPMMLDGHLDSRYPNANHVHLRAHL